MEYGLNPSATRFERHAGTCLRLVGNQVNARTEIMNDTLTLKKTTPTAHNGSINGIVFNDGGPLRQFVMPINATRQGWMGSNSMIHGISEFRPTHGAIIS